MTSKKAFFRRLMLSINRFITNGKFKMAIIKTSRTHTDRDFLYSPNYQFPLVITILSWKKVPTRQNYVIQIIPLWKIASLALITHREVIFVWNYMEIIIKCNFQIHQEVLFEAWIIIFVNALQTNKSCVISWAGRW
jgi:hypothetical protein